MDTSRLRAKLRAAGKKTWLPSTKLPPLPPSPKPRASELPPAVSPDAEESAPEAAPQPAPLLPLISAAAVVQDPQDPEPEPEPAPTVAQRSWTKLRAIPLLQKSALVGNVRRIRVNSWVDLENPPSKDEAKIYRQASIPQQPVHSCSKCCCSASVCYLCFPHVYRRNLAQYGVGIYLVCSACHSISTKQLNDQSSNEICVRSTSVA